MYLPELFRVEDVPQMHALMRARPFAALVSAGSDGLFASHLPTVLKDEGRYGVIECHLARANPHWRDLAASGETLMIFQGAQGYITPNWYPSKAEDGKVVPTWNFAVVHAYGRTQVMGDEEWLRRHVTGLTIWIIPVLVAITFHEAAHGLAAHLLGDDTAWQLGRVSFNPLKHVDPVGTILLPGILLLVRSPFLFGYAKPVPVNFRALRSPRRDMVLVAAAGPAMNIALVVVAALLFHLVGYLPTTLAP
jgi:hypothetical protein